MEPCRNMASEVEIDANEGANGRQDDPDPFSQPRNRHLIAQLAPGFGSTHERLVPTADTKNITHSSSAYSTSVPWTEVQPRCHTLLSEPANDIVACTSWANEPLFSPTSLCDAIVSLQYSNYFRAACSLLLSLLAFQPTHRALTVRSGIYVAGVVFREPMSAPSCAPWEN
jgi:hypothetical protein